MCFETLLKTVPAVYRLPSYDLKPQTGCAGIKALWYEGVAYRGKPKKVFAYLGESDAACCKIFRDEKVKKYWNATDRLSRVTFPVFWFCWLPDPDFCCLANSRSYLAT